MGMVPTHEIVDKPSFRIGKEQDWGWNNTLSVTVNGRGEI